MLLFGAILVMATAYGLTRLEPPAPEPGPVIPARLETTPVLSDQDAADDIAIWVHAERPERSTILGTDKRKGLSIYDLDGERVWAMDLGRVNGIDLRQGVDWGGAIADIVACSDKRANSLVVFRVEDEGRSMVSLGTRLLGEDLDVDGVCLYVSPHDGGLYAFVTDMAGPLEQWRLWPTDEGGVRFERVRAWTTGKAMEGCVADDETGLLFVSAEEHGLLAFDAEPDRATDAPRVIDHVGHGGRLRLDIEGLAIYREPAGHGYLLVSSQGSDDFVVYDRHPPHAFRGRFSVVLSEEGGDDPVTHTDGIEVTSASLGGPFHRGLFVCQDDVNGDANQNFKLVAWSDIALALGLEDQP